MLALGAAGCGSSATSSKPPTSTPPVAARYPQPSAEAEAALLAAIKTVRSCMTRKGLSVSGGPIYPQGSPTSPDGELITGGVGGAAYIAFYTDASRAKELEPELRHNVIHTGGATVQRRGAVTVVFARRPGKSVRTAVLACAFS